MEAPCPKKGTGVQIVPVAARFLVYPPPIGSVHSQEVSRMKPRIFVQTMIGLASAALGLVAALAWNAAIQATIKRLLGTADSLLGLYLYAVFATAIAIGVLLLLGKVASRLGSESAIRREADNRLARRGRAGQRADSSAYAAIATPAPPTTPPARNASRRRASAATDASPIPSCTATDA